MDITSRIILLNLKNSTKYYECRKSNASVRRGGGGGAFPPYELGSQNSPYKLGLIMRMEHPRPYEIH